jgi:uncharacterized protein GlcG (DUF336 family)/NAD-dependent dihydropyrimidine dehydrogenase PreA subunit
MPYVITELCTNDGACVEVCPVACIHTKPGAPQHYIDPEICIECEQCEIVCPVDAIFLDWKLPEEHTGSIDVNASFFRQNKAAVGPVSMETAFEMAHAAEGYAREVGAAIAVAVVDEAGSPIVVTQMPGAKPWAAELALHKAYSSAAYWLPTQELRGETRRPSFRSMVINRRGRITAGGGGMPIAHEVSVRGAIGVAGGRDDEQDALCCRAGLSVLETPVH